jgi:hypothetical protein
MADKEDEVVAFGMTGHDIAETVKALSMHLDENSPVKSNSYSGFLEVINSGHNALMTQKTIAK